MACRRGHSLGCTTTREPIACSSRIQTRRCAGRGRSRAQGPAAEPLGSRSVGEDLLSVALHARRAARTISIMQFDHVEAPSNDIPASVEWYRTHFGATVLYQDKTW